MSERMQALPWIGIRSAAEQPGRNWVLSDMGGVSEIVPGILLRHTAAWAAGRHTCVSIATALDGANGLAGVVVSPGEQPF
mgnify:CR=1 FL=1